MESSILYWRCEGLCVYDGGMGDIDNMDHFLALFSLQMCDIHLVVGLASLRAHRALASVAGPTLVPGVFSGS